MKINFNPNGLTKYETVEVMNISFEIDVFNLISDENILVNVNSICKKYGKLPKDWLTTDNANRYINHVCERESLGQKDVYPFGKTNLITVVKGGAHSGTWISNKVIFPFLRWVDVAFEYEMDVYLKQKISDDVLQYQSRQNARYGYFPLVKALEEYRDSLGKDTEEHHKINEFRMIAKIATGYTPAKYREKYNVEFFRDHLAPHKIYLLEHLQKANVNLIDMKLDYRVRKGLLETLRDNIKDGTVTIK